MYLLYVDESGNYSERDDFFAIGGVAIHEGDLVNFRKRVSNVLKKHLDPHLRGLEIHAQHMRSGRGPWRGISRDIREALLDDLCKMIARFPVKRMTPFALFSVVSSPRAVPHADLLERCFEELFLRFNEFLIRQNRQGPGPYGMVVIDEAKYESLLQPVTRKWREEGTRFKKLRRIIEVPMFCDSKQSQLVQIADLVVHMAYRAYARDNAERLDIMLPSFDATGGVYHGLTHLTPNFRSCICPACHSRKQKRAWS